MARNLRRSKQKAAAAGDPQQDLIAAVEHNDLVTAGKLVQTDNTLLSSSLRRCCEQGKVQVVKTLLEKFKINLDFAPSGKLPPLFCALKYCEGPSEERSYHQADNGDDWQTRHDSGKRIVQLLLQHGANSELRNPNKQTPLMATKSNEIARILIERGANIDAQDEDGRTVLMYAVWRQLLGTVKILLEKGANVDAIDKRGRNIWHHLAMDNSRPPNDDDDELERFLLSTSALTEARDETQRTPLHWAADRGTVRLARLLLSQGKAQTESVEQHDQTPLHLAVTHNHIEMTRLLLDYGASIEAISDGGWSVYLTACASRGDPHEIVKELLDQGQDLHERLRTGHWTALHLAAEYNCDSKTVALLIDRGIKVNEEAAMAWAPLHSACRPDTTYREATACIKIVDTLLRNNAELNRKTVGGQTPLQLAAEAGNRELLAHLLKRKDTPPTPKDNFGNAALLSATFADQQDIVSLFAPWAERQVQKMSTEAEKAAKAFEAIIVDIGPEKRQLLYSWQMCPTVYDLLYQPKSDDRKWTKCKAGASVRWIHLPANNLQWCRDLLTRYFIENAACGGNVHEYQALERSLSQHHHGQQPHSSHMRTLYQTVPSCSEDAPCYVPVLRGIDVDEDDVSFFAELPRSDTDELERGGFVDGGPQLARSNREGRATRPSLDRLRVEQSPDAVLNDSWSNRSELSEQRPLSSTAKKEPVASKAYMFIPYLHFDLEYQRQRMSKVIRSAWETSRREYQQTESAVLKKQPSTSPSLQLQQTRSNVVSKVLSRVASKDVPKDVSKDVSKAVSKIGSKDVSTDMSKNVSKGVSKDVSTDISKDVSKDVSKDELLVRAHLRWKDCSLHPRRTLDQSFYRNIDTKCRDEDQIIFKYQKHAEQERDAEREMQNSTCTTSPQPNPTSPEPPKKPVDTSKFKILMVDQLWIWVLGPDLIFSSFPQRWDQPAHDPDNVVDKVLYELHSNNHGSINNAYELAMMIAGHCFDVFDRQNSFREDTRFLEMFEAAIGVYMDKEAGLFDDFTKYSGEFSTWLSSKPPGVVEKLLDIGRETRLLREVKDVIGELEMLRLIFTHQKSVLEDMHKAFKPAEQAAPHPHVISRGFLVEETKRMEKQAMHIYRSLKDLLDLKQKQANAIEARYARDQAAGTERQGDITLIFTAVTVVFLPISFIAAFFAIPVAEYTRNESGDTEIPLSEASTYVFGLGLSISLFCVIIAIFKESLTKWMVLRRSKTSRLGTSGSFGEKDDSIQPAAKSLKSKTSRPGTFGWLGGKDNSIQPAAESLGSRVTNRFRRRKRQADEEANGHATTPKK